MKMTLLRELSSRVVRIPSNWSTARMYDQLVADGLAVSVTAGVGPLQSGYEITPKGRKALLTSAVKPFWTTSH